MNEHSNPDLIISQLIRSHRRTIAIEITRDGSLIVRAPIRAPVEFILKLVHEKSAWILKKQGQAKSRQALAPQKQFIEGEPFLYLGQYYQLRIIDQADRPLTIQGQFHLSRNHTHQARDIFISWYKTAARQIFTERTDWYATLHGLKYTKIRINNARTRWGSCSVKGNINLNWRLIMAPLLVIDYMVVHELAHLVERNHSRAYWDKVESMLPGYKEPRRWLRKNGHLLTI